MLRDESKPLLTVDETIKCYDCCPREEQFIREAKESITIEQVQEFYEFLQESHKLDNKSAFDVIYYLQEVLRVLPTHYEECRICGDLFDSENSGCIAGYCDGCGCQQDYDSFENGCDDCPDVE
ncbi:MAG: hypothetical protein WC315_06125 [Candidatus Omnitrophota bacterium]|jgi:hypothetical protein